MAVKAPSITTTKSGAKKAPPTYDAIAERSYELYLARGQHDGHDVEDWLAAEAELSAS
ncbi:MAG TPA: DUF2934 domain-containing protein [Polyangia bacterium]|nr:DUF2934 domain-containing protein [Polyangia bacterium]